MDITEKVCGVSPSAKRLCTQLHRHGVEVVICLRKHDPHQVMHPAHENERDVMHPSGVSVSNRDSTKAVMYSNRNEFYFDSLTSGFWSRKDSILVKDYLKKSGYPVSSVCRKADLFVRQAGKLNPKYLGTLVSSNRLQSNSKTDVLVLTKLAYSQPVHSVIIGEIREFLNRSTTGKIFILVRNISNQYLLEKVR